MDKFMQAAIDQAKKSLNEGGIPIGAVLVKDGEIIAAGHNKRVQQNSHILHGEMDCLNNLNRNEHPSLKNTVLYSTLMPCAMCAGTVKQFNIPKVVVGESVNFKGEGDFMKAVGVEVVDLNDPTCIEMMKQFIEDRPELWYEDIGLAED